MSRIYKRRHGFRWWLARFRDWVIANFSGLRMW